MAEGHDISGSDDKAVWEPDTELYLLELDGSDWQYLQLNGERLIWRSDLEEFCLKLSSAARKVVVARRK